MKNFLYAIALLIGTIIGVGIFGLPYVAAQTGFAIVLVYLIGLGLITLLVHLFYGEIVLKTPGKHRLVGYAQRYLGKWGKQVATVSSVFGFYGALLAYIIVSGQFLKALFGGSAVNWSLLFFGLASLFIFLGLRIIARVEFFMVLFLFLAMLIIFVSGWSHINWTNLVTFDFSYFFLPYGVVLFALAGSAAVPEMAELIKNKKLKLAIILGTLIPVILFIVFTFVVVGVTGKSTTQEALIGLQKVLGPRIMFIGLVFGVLALFTSFLTLGLNLKKVFCYDYKLNQYLAWFLACFVPLLFFILGIRNFIEVIGLVGAILGGIDGILIALIYTKLKKSWLLPGVLILVFILGIIYELKFF